MNYIEVNCQVCTKKRHIDIFFQCVCAQPICDICMLQLVPVPKVIDLNLNKVELLSISHILSCLFCRRNISGCVPLAVTVSTLHKKHRIHLLAAKNKSCFIFTNFVGQRLH